jgi:hypothetical protein
MNYKWNSTVKVMKVLTVITTPIWGIFQFPHELSAIGQIFLRISRMARLHIFSIEQMEIELQ